MINCTTTAPGIPGTVALRYTRIVVLKDFPASLYGEPFPLYLPKPIATR